MSSTSKARCPKLRPSPYFSGVPVVGQLQERSPIGCGLALVCRCRQEDEGVSAGLAFDAANLLHAELVAVEIKALVDIADTHHRVQIAQGHRDTSWLFEAIYRGHLPRPIAPSTAVMQATLPRAPRRGANVTVRGEPLGSPKIATRLSQFRRRRSVSLVGRRLGVRRARDRFAGTFMTRKIPICVQ